MSPLARRPSLSICRPNGRTWPCARPRSSVRTMPAWICFRHAAALYSCSRSTAFAARGTRSNTTLGIVRLLAPPTRAAMLSDAGTEPDSALRDALGDVLAATTVDDARDVYAAIRLAAPGGLGRAEQQDVVDEPTMTLVEVMRLAAERDSIAREYITAFELTFLTGVPALERARGDALSWDDAVVETFLSLLAAA